VLATALIAFSSWKPSGEVEVADPVFTADALAIAQTRCLSCHSATPTAEGFVEAPGGVMFDTPEQLKSHSQKVLSQSVLTEAMPLGNLTEMTALERARLGAWIRAGMPDEETTDPARRHPAAGPGPRPASHRPPSLRRKASRRISPERRMPTLLPATGIAMSGVVAALTLCGPHRPSDTYVEVRSEVRGGQVVSIDLDATLRHHRKCTARLMEA
jgi:mono/diheme cytochrome c family protein